MKPLLFIPSPRDIPEFKTAIDKIRHDKLFVKYYPQEEAYTKARQWFLEDDRYSHLIILPDDLMVNQNILDILLADTKEHNIISGWCANTIKDNGESDSNISIAHLPPDPPLRNLYHELHFESLTFVEHVLKVGVPIIPVKHQGFALTVLAKHIVKKVPFRTSAGCCVDSCLSLDLDRMKITQFVDLRARSRHIKTNPDILRVGIAKPEMIFEAKC